MCTDVNALNHLYAPLHTRCVHLLQALRADGLAAQSGWYNEHYRRDAIGAYQPDYYPIPVITVADLCDVELDFRSICITAKRTREGVLSSNFAMPDSPDFEAYGAADYLLDFRLPGDSLEQMRAKIRRSDEQCICFSFPLPADAPPEIVVALVRQLQRHHFFY